MLSQSYLPQSQIGSAISQCCYTPLIRFASEFMKTVGSETEWEAAGRTRVPSASGDRRCATAAQCLPRGAPLSAFFVLGGGGLDFFVGFAGGLAVGLADCATDWIRLATACALWMDVA